MNNIARILVPTDGSEGSVKAAEFAGELARALQANVTVVCVQSDDFLMEHAWGAADFIGGRPEGLNSVEQIRDSLESAARKEQIPGTLDALGTLGNDPEVALLWGHASDSIVKYANEHDISLIVMGSHGRSGLRRAFLGSVSQAVANQAECPVTIVK